MDRSEATASVTSAEHELELSSHSLTLSSLHVGVI